MLYLIDYYRHNKYVTKIVEACCYELAIKKSKIKNIDEIREITTKYFSEKEVKELQERYRKEEKARKEYNATEVQLL